MGDIKTHLCNKCEGEMTLEEYRDNGGICLSCLLAEEHAIDATATALKKLYNITFNINRMYKYFEGTKTVYALLSRYGKEILNPIVNYLLEVEDCMEVIGATSLEFKVGDEYIERLYNQKHAILHKLEIFKYQLCVLIDVDKLNPSTELPITDTLEVYLTKVEEAINNMSAL